MPSLFIIRGNDQGGCFTLKGEEYGIGRDPTNKIQLHDTEVSRRHAKLLKVKERLQIALIDLGSSNGTFVNNRRIQQHYLESGDEVRIGSTVMIFRYDEDDDPRGAQNVDIIAQQTNDDSSHIVQAMSPEESGRILQGGEDSSNSAWLNKALSNFEVMYRTTLAVRHTLDIDQLLNRILKIIFEWVEADRGCALLVENETRRLEPRVRLNRNEGDADEKIIISKTIIDYVMKKGQGVLSSDARGDDRWGPAASILQHNIREAICVPMQGRHNNMVGLIYIDTSTTPEQIISKGVARRFNEEHLKLLVAIGHQAAMAVEDTRYYRELMQAERLAAIGQTIATLSHHIKNILQGVNHTSYAFERVALENLNKSISKLPDSPEKAEMVKTFTSAQKSWELIKRNKDRISSLVMDMLTFSKEREPSLELNDLNGVVGDVVESVRRRAEDKGIQLLWRPANNMPQLTFDRNGIYHAVMNVVTNAFDACENEEDPKVLVKTEHNQKENLAKVIIEDTGVGIPEEEVEKLFTLFHSTKKGGGTGLGLSVSNKILREHGGKIVVKSKVGEGSRFTLMFPAIERDEGSSDDVHRTVTIPKPPGLSGGNGQQPSALPPKPTNDGKPQS